MENFLCIPVCPRGAPERRFFRSVLLPRGGGNPKRAEKSPYPGDTGDSFFFRIRIKRIKDLISVHFLWI